MPKRIVQLAIEKLLIFKYILKTLTNNCDKSRIVFDVLVSVTSDPINSIKYC